MPEMKKIDASVFFVIQMNLPGQGYQCIQILQAYRIPVGPGYRDRIDH